MKEGALVLLIGCVTLGACIAPSAPRARPEGASRESPFVNSIGMEFVPVPGTRVLFGVWETRVGDYERFVKDAGGTPETFLRSILRRAGGDDDGGTWNDPGFKQTPDHPVVWVGWGEARAFCEWLTERERRMGWIGPGQSYRLPTDAEWSSACGLPAESGGTPAERDSKIPDIYVWGRQWPPPQGAANLAGVEVVKRKGWRGTEIEGWTDGHVRTAPAGRHRPNRYGIHDLGGNVSEWCVDGYAQSGQGSERTLRGPAWCHGDPPSLLASRRFRISPWARDDFIGFRCVLAGVRAGAS